MSASQPVEKLMAAMANQIGACVLMRECIARQRRAIVEQDLGRLKEATGAMQIAGDGVKAAGVWLAGVQQECAGVAQFSDEQERQWNSATRTLDRLWEDLRQEARFNGEILADALGYTRRLLETLLPEGRNGHDGGVLVDWEAAAER